MASFFQGGSSVELLSAQGKDPTSKWKLQGKINRGFDKVIRSNTFALAGGAETRMQVPKASSLGLAHRFLVLQLQIPFTRSFGVEVSFSDFQGVRRRLVFSSAFRETTLNALHVQIPMTSQISRNIWMNFVFDLMALIELYFPAGCSYRCVESLSITGTCKLKRVFVMKDAPTSSVLLDHHPAIGKQAQTTDIPRQFVFATGVRNPVPTEYFLPPNDSSSSTKIGSMDISNTRQPTVTKSRLSQSASTRPKVVEGRNVVRPQTHTVRMQDRKSKVSGRGRSEKTTPSGNLGIKDLSRQKSPFNKPSSNSPVSLAIPERDHQASGRELIDSSDLVTVTEHTDSTEGNVVEPSVKSEEESEKEEVKQEEDRKDDRETRRQEIFDEIRHKLDVLDDDDDASGKKHHDRFMMHTKIPATDEDVFSIPDTDIKDKFDRRRIQPMRSTGYDTSQSIFAFSTKSRPDAVLQDDQDVDEHPSQSNLFNFDSLLNTVEPKPSLEPTQSEEEMKANELASTRVNHGGLLEDTKEVSVDENDSDSDDDEELMEMLAKKRNERMKKSEVASSNGDKSKFEDANASYAMDVYDDRNEIQGDKSENSSINEEDESSPQSKDEDGRRIFDLDLSQGDLEGFFTDVDESVSIDLTNDLQDVSVEDSRADIMLSSESLGKQKSQSRLEVKPEKADQVDQSEERERSDDEESFDFGDLIEKDASPSRDEFEAHQPEKSGDSQESAAKGEDVHVWRKSKQCASPVLERSNQTEEMDSKEANERIKRLLQSTESLRTEGRNKEKGKSSAVASESIELIYDPVLRCYHDPVANKYYALNSN